MFATMKKSEEILVSLAILGFLLRELRRGFSPLASWTLLDVNNAEFSDDDAAATIVPEDVEEGHFPVIAAKGRETQRFVVKLDHLKNPAFLALLEQAQDEYGFHQEGVLLVPCQPKELQKILEEKKEMCQ